MNPFKVNFQEVKNFAQNALGGIRKANTQQKPKLAYKLKIDAMNGLSKLDPEVVAAKNFMETVAMLIKSIWLADTNGNGKVEGTEYFGLVTRLFPTLMASYGDITILAAKWRNFDSMEIDILLEYGTTIDFLPNDKRKVNDIIKLIFNIAAFNKSAVGKLLGYLRQDAPADMTETLIDPVVRMIEKEEIEKEEIDTSFDFSNGETDKELDAE